jgi:hypothetical protein
LNDIAQIETTLGDPGARPRRPLPDPKDTHRSTHPQMALFGPTIAWVRGVQSGYRPGQSEHVYQQAFSEIISSGAKHDQAVDKAFKADRGDLRQIPDRERLTLRR